MRGKIKDYHHSWIFLKSLWVEPIILREQRKEIVIFIVYRFEEGYTGNPFNCGNQKSGHNC